MGMNGFAKIQASIAGFTLIVCVHIKADAMNLSKPTHEMHIDRAASSMKAAKDYMHVLADSPAERHFRTTGSCPFM